MRRSEPRHLCASGLASVLLGVCILLGAAREANAEPPPAKDWEVEILGYGWLPRLDAEVEGPNGSTADVEVGMDDVLESLEFAAKGRVSARWRRWVVAADGLWVRLGQDASFGRGPLRIDADFEQRMALAQLLGGYRVFSRPGGLFGTAAPGDARRFGIDVLGGANYVYLGTDIDLKRVSLGPFTGRSRNFGHSDDWVAPAVGLRFQNDLTERLRLETLAVASGFGVGAAPEISWQLTTLLSYRFTDHWLVSVGHRLLDVEGGGDFEPELLLQGPVLGVGYRF
jgi:hypothetical protein